MWVEDVERFADTKQQELIAWCLFFRGHEREMERRFGVAADAWNSSGHDGVLEAFTQSHPRVPEQSEAPAR